VPFRTQFGFPEPIFGKFLPAIRHVLAAENPHPQHFFGCQLGLEPGVKVLSHRFGKRVPVSLLHLVANDHGFLFLSGHE